MILGITDAQAEGQKATQHTCANGIEDQIQDMIKKMGNAPARLQDKVERYAAIDVALPMDAAENIKLDCHAVVLITAITHDATEFPIEAHVDGKKLTPIFCVDEKNSNPKASKMFGNNRASCFFFVGIDTLSQPGELMIDWAQNRKDFSIDHFPLGETIYKCTPQKNSPDLSAALALIKREYCVARPW